MISWIDMATNEEVTWVKSRREHNRKKTEGSFLFDISFRKEVYH